MFRNVTDKGAWGEMVVIADLLRRGLEVFRACSPGASCDLAVLRDGKVWRVEVRCAHLVKDYAYVNRPAEEACDILAVVLQSGEVHYHPPLEGEPTICFALGSRFDILVED